MNVSKSLPPVPWGILALALVLFLSGSCGNVTSGNFSEGLRAMTGKGGTHEERDIISEVKPTAMDMATYEPRPVWETGLEADAVDLLEFVAPDRVLVGTVQLDPMLAAPSFGPVMLLEASSGREIWRSQRSSSEGSLYSLLSGSPSMILLDSSRRALKLQALDPATGAARWERTYEQPAHARALPEAGLVLVALAGKGGNRISGLAEADGSEAWSLSLAGGAAKTGTSPDLVPAMDRLLVVADTVALVRIKDGRTHWQVPNPAGDEETFGLILQGGILLRSQNRLWMLRAADGSTQWGPVDLGYQISALTPAPGRQDRAFAVLRSTTAAGGDSVCALDFATGGKLWTRSPGTRVLSGLLVDGDRVLFSTADRLEALASESGRTLFKAGLPQGIAGLSGQSMPDQLALRGKRVILSREMRGVAAVDPVSGTVVWYQPVDLFRQADFWYVTREKTLYEASGMSREYGTIAEADRIWWNNFLYSSDVYWRTQDAVPGSPSSLPGGLSTSQWQANMAFVNSMLSLSAAVDRGLKQGALSALVSRKKLELEHSVRTHLRSIQGRYWLRPYDARGTGVAVVDLDTGKRADFEFSAPNHGMSKYGLLLPAFAVDPSGLRLMTAGISLDTDRWQRYVKFKYGMPYPSVMSFDLASLDFTAAWRNNPALPRKADSGKLEEVQGLIRSGAWVDTRDSFGNTALMNASFQGHEEVVRLLLQSGAAVNLRNRESAFGTAMERAAANGHVGTVRLLLEAGADPREGMRVAATRGKEEVVEFFRKEGYEAPPGSLQEAAGFGDVASARSYLDAGADINAAEGSTGTTPLMLAAQRGHGEVVRLLLDRGAKVNVQERSGQRATALMMASRTGAVETVRLLIEKGASINTRDADKFTALHYAAEGGSVEAADLLIRAGADLGAKSGLYRTTPLLAAAGTEGNPEMARLLLGKGAKADDRDKDGRSAISRAAYGGHLEMVKVLLSGGASVDLPDSNGETPLIRAAAQGHLPVVRTLLKAGADVNHRDKAGKTALGQVNSHYWGKKGTKGKMIKVLQAAGGI